MKRFWVSLSLCLLTACSKSGEGGQGAPPAVPVQVTKIEPQPLESYADYLATLVSRRAVTLYPQVSGYVRSIDVKPGAEVKAGAVLLQIDASAEKASLRNLVATRESLEASSGFAKQRLQRSTALRGDGIVSQQDADQARVQADQAEASLRATDALIASQRARLGFFQIVAPFDGVVGNVPVKVGDFVAPQTELTSVTQDSGLEAEVSIPVERAALLTPKSLIRLIDTEGKEIASSAVIFVSPRADPATQLLLIKGAFASTPLLRADQVVRARVVWSSDEGIAIPSSAVLRQAGQTFAFVVEQKKAKRIPVTLGALQGAQYVVAEGLKGGEQVVTSGLQQVSDGAEVEVSAPAASDSGAGGAQR